MFSHREANMKSQMLSRVGINRVEKQGSTVNSRYLDFGYLESRLISKRNLVLVSTPKSKIRVQNIVEKSRNWERFLSFSTIFSIYVYN